MERSYKQTFTLTDLYLDCHRRLKPSTLLYLIQEAAGNHAALLGAGWEALAEKELFWALIRHKLRIHRLPQAGQTITLETWPMPTTRLCYPRATVAYDRQGNVLFESHALWVLMDRNTRQMVLPGKSGVLLECDPRPCPVEAPGSIAPKELENAADRTVGYTMLDRNGHMNNTYYLDWVDDLLDGAFHRTHPLRQLHISYLSEAREGQQLRLFWQKDPQNILRVEGKTGPEYAHRVFAVVADYGCDVP